MGLLLSDIDEPSKKKTKDTDSGEIAESDDAASDNQQETPENEQLTEENVTTVRGVNVDAVLSGTSVQDLLFPVIRSSQLMVLKLRYRRFTAKADFIGSQHESEFQNRP